MALQANSNSLTPANLHPKFYPYLLGHPKCEKSDFTLEDVQKRFFAEDSQPEIIKINESDRTPYIQKADGIFLKGPRKDFYPFKNDTHLYRLRKADKIKRFIQTHPKYQDCFLIPQKRLIWNENDQNFYVVVEEISISDTVAKPVDQIESSLIYWGAKDFEQGKNSQRAKLLLKPKNVLAISELQIECMAHLNTLGHIDQTYENLYFSQDLRHLIILDTEPIKRGIKWHLFKSCFGRIFRDKPCIKLQQAIFGFVCLKQVCTTERHLKIVEKIEKSFMLRGIACLVGKLALVCLGILGLTFLSVTGLILVCAKTALLFSLILKGFMLSKGIVNVIQVWNKSNFEGLVSLDKWQRQGHF